MLYKFKSKATGDLIMLEPNGRLILETIGKEPAAKGILEVADMPHALAALREAIARAEAPRHEDVQGSEDEEQRAQSVSLRQRAVPFIDMIQRCQKEDEPIVWGV